MDYEQLKTKADKCRLNAMKADSLWAFNFWSLLAMKLEEEALNKIVK